MDLLSMLRTLGGLGVVLGMLAGALWAVRRYDIKLPGRVSGTSRKRVEMVERLTLDAKRSVALIRRDDAEHLILIAPDGHIVIETGIVKPAFAQALSAASAPAAAPEAPAAPAASVVSSMPMPVAMPAAEPSVPAQPTNDNLSDLRSGFGQLVEAARTRMKAHG